MVTCLDRLGQFLLWTYIIYHFGTLLFIEILLRRAFEDIGKGNATREHRVVTLQRIYRKELVCNSLQANSHFRWAYALTNLIKPVFIGFICILTITISLKYLSGVRV